MVIHGWLDLHESSPSDERLEAAVRAGDFLLEHQDADGAWRGEAEYFRIPHTYCARVSWALIRLAAATGEDSYREAARRQLDWVLGMQQDNGWFASCNFKPGRDPNTHGIAYTLRGLLESAALLEHEPYLAAVRRTSDALIGRLETFGGRLPATFDSTWKPTSRYECLTGIAQLGGVWLRLYELTGDARYRDAGLRGGRAGRGRQARSSWAAIDGALPGSYPIYGRYAPLQFPNWATKFLVDSLLLRERVQLVIDDARARRTSTPASSVGTGGSRAAAGGAGSGSALAPASHISSSTRRSSGSAAAGGRSSCSPNITAKIAAAA